MPGEDIALPPNAWVRMVGFAIALLLGAGAGRGVAEDFPSRALRVIVPTAAGSYPDIVVRLLQPYLERNLKQPLIIENRAGASTMIGTDTVAKAAPDGHTLLIVPTTFTVNVALNPKLPFDIDRDFEPVAILVKNPLMFVINAKVPARTLGEFVALAKASPGKFNYGTSGASSQAHLLIEMWSARAGIHMQHLPYRGGGPAALAAVAGEAQLLLMSPVGVLPHIESGSLRALATGGAQRDPDQPNLPTAAEAGFPGFEAEQWLGLLTTGGTPKEIVQKLNAELNRALREPDVVAKLKLQGTTAVGGTPEQFRALIATEIRNWKETAQRANIPAE
jgi:tripartite-type tricarboxylate transporter receptor subunit TctC